MSSTAPHSPRPATTGGRSRLRLTRRGRVVLTMLGAAPLAAVIGFSTLNGGGATATDEASTASFEYVTVGSGMTLWEIARDVAPTDDPRDVIVKLQRLNGLDGPTVHPGQQLAVPLQYS